MAVGSRDVTYVTGLYCVAQKRTGFSVDALADGVKLGVLLLERLCVLVAVGDREIVDDALSTGITA